jgi:hypothetical protein
MCVLGYYVGDYWNNCLRAGCPQDNLLVNPLE